MIYVRGADSAIAKALAEIHPISRVPRYEHMPLGGSKYLFCVGFIRQKRIAEQGDDEIAETFLVNAANVIRECERLLENNEGARICVVGSESGFKWSFDGAYAAAKAALHRYVETRRLRHPMQQLVCVAPTCVLNTRMNMQRNSDGIRVLEERRKRHPKQRWLEPEEVAHMINFLLNVDKGYTTGVVIRMNGGEHCV